MSKSGLKVCETAVAECINILFGVFVCEDFVKA